MIPSPCVAVVVPAYCEERLLPKTLSGMPAFVDHIIVVDDGSRDATFEVAQALAHGDSRVHVIRLAFNQGVGLAIVRGYQRALDLGADVVAVMAADNQMDPAELWHVLEPVLADRADYAKGNRLVHQDIQNMPRLRKWGTHLLARVTGALAGYESLDDAQCGYTAISRRMLKRLPLDSMYPRYGYPNDMILRLGEQGARLEQPTVTPVYADEVSGFKVHQVVVPISGILLRGALRRVSQRVS